MTRKATTRKAAARKTATKKKAAGPKKAPPSKVTQSKGGAAAWAERMSKDRKYKGKVQVATANTLKTSYTLRRPTGILGLDIALGGGFHAGGGAQVYGGESVGKTHLVFRICGQLQKIYGDKTAIYIYSTEIKPDKGFARCAGCCIAYSPEEIAEYDVLRQQQGLPPFTKEEIEDLQMQVGDIVIGTSENADVGLQMVVEALGSRLFQLIVIESLGALLPKEVDEEDVGKGHYGGSSKLMTVFQSKTYPEFMMLDADGNPNETTIIGINQARAIIGGPPKGRKTKPAADAWAWKHGQLVSLELTRGADIREGDGGPVTGKLVRWRMAKGKAGTHDGKSGEFNYFHVERAEPIFWKDVEEYWMGGVDVITEAVETARDLGVIDVAGSWASWSDEKGNTLVRAQGLGNFAIELNKDEALVKRLWDECLKKSGLLVRYT
jgi:recombination protein RecA